MVLTVAEGRRDATHALVTPIMTSIDATLLAVLAAAVTCTGGARQPGAGPSAAGAAYPVTAVVGLGTPASALHDPALDVWYVSSVVGERGRKDGRGFITRLSGDGRRGFDVETEWVVGGKSGAVLHAPQGMALVGDTLWVADVDALRGFDRRTGRPVASVDLAPLGAVYLNDVAAGPDGALYVTDSDAVTGPGGLVRWTGGGRVYRVDAGRRASVALAHERLSNPDGIAWDARRGHFVLAPMRGDTIRAWRPGDAAPRALAAGPGWYDGVVATADGRVLVASRTTAAVYELVGGELVTVLDRLPGVADIGLDDARGWLAVPLSDAGRVAFYPLPPAPAAARSAGR